MNGQRLSVHGKFDPQFQKVVDAFVENFEHHDELGAACAITVDGEVVVDIWAGHRDLDKRHPWEEDTCVVVFSAAKGISAAALAIAHSRGWFDYDEKVCTYWPAFAQGGKHEVTVRQLLNHEAGLCAIRKTKIPKQKLYDLDWMAEVLAKEEPAWAPGTKRGYHALSLGFYENEFLRRVDPYGRSLRAFVIEEMGDVLGAEVFIGIPEDFPKDRLAEVRDYHPLSPLLYPKQVPVRMFLRLLWPGSLTFQSVANPLYKRPSEMATHEAASVEFAASTGTASARGLSAMYGAMVARANPLQLSEDTLDQLEAPAPRFDEVDALLTVHSAFSLGFMKPSPAFAFGSTTDCFGASGSGGSFGFADPALRLGYGYVTNRLLPTLMKDPRDIALRQACYDCLGARESCRLDRERSRTR